ncbi:hypothetical protein BDK51DRAFT_38857 [Blyttiomyces helicus]|uniref:Uncharacterized protein n=1 Tax=Blyttiomyces helicus TaxID=388810 RepID=A0A4P9WA56_9FUNG|nr:hypothetical protein BDK51DRAFT_38857 [Blyttiomyces helicus]|eukprot:RKO87720.1 hypothetical protein BDK51DRAFT_38857 [Blyttiomyces helicus]
MSDNEARRLGQRSPPSLSFSPSPFLTNPRVPPHHAAPAPTLAAPSLHPHRRVRPVRAPATRGAPPTVADRRAVRAPRVSRRPRAAALPGRADARNRCLRISVGLVLADTIRNVQAVALPDPLCPIPTVQYPQMLAALPILKSGLKRIRAQRAFLQTQLTACLADLARHRQACAQHAEINVGIGGELLDAGVDALAKDKMILADVQRILVKRIDRIVFGIGVVGGAELRDMEEVVRDVVGEARGEVRRGKRADEEGEQAGRKRKRTGGEEIDVGDPGRAPALVRQTPEESDPSRRSSSERVVAATPPGDARRPALAHDESPQASAVLQPGAARLARPLPEGEENDENVEEKEDEDEDEDEDDDDDDVPLHLGNSFLLTSTPLDPIFTQVAHGRLLLECTQESRTTLGDAPRPISEESAGKEDAAGPPDPESKESEDLVPVDNDGGAIEVRGSQTDPDRGRDEGGAEEERNDDDYYHDDVDDQAAPPLPPPPPPSAAQPAPAPPAPARTDVLRFWRTLTSNPSPPRADKENVPIDPDEDADAGVSGGSASTGCSAAAAAGSGSAPFELAEGTGLA